MALGVGSIVTMKSASADLPVATNGPDFTPQPPKVGKVLAVESGYTVLWEDGILNTSLPAAGFDDLYSVSLGAHTRSWGKIVAIDGESPDYQYLVVSMFRRGGALATELAIVRALGVAAWREVRVSELVVVAGH